MDKQIRNATITSTSLGNDERGPSFWVNLTYGGAGQGFGGYFLGGAFTHYVIMGILNTLEVDNWEDLKGTPVRVESDGGKVYRIGHYLKDKWFDPAEWKEEK